MPQILRNRESPQKVLYKRGIDRLTTVQYSTVQGTSSYFKNKASLTNSYSTASSALKYNVADAPCSAV